MKLQMQHYDQCQVGLVGQLSLSVINKSCLSTPMSNMQQERTQEVVKAGHAATAVVS